LPDVSSEGRIVLNFALLWGTVFVLMTYRGVLLRAAMRVWVGMFMAGFCALNLTYALLARHSRVHETGRSRMAEVVPDVDEWISRDASLLERMKAYMKLHAALAVLDIVPASVWNMAQSDALPRMLKIAYKGFPVFMGKQTVDALLLQHGILLPASARAWAGLPALKPAPEPAPASREEEEEEEDSTPSLTTLPLPVTTTVTSPSSSSSPRTTPPPPSSTSPTDESDDDEEDDAL
jgi:hypothetical protein